MRKLILCLAILVVALASRAAERSGNLLSSILTQDFLQTNLCQPTLFNAVPPYGDPFWTDSIPQAMRHSFAKEARRYDNTPWWDFDADLFASSTNKGDFSKYEKQLYAKRKQMATLVMSELMGQTGERLPAIMKGIESMLGETWWGHPANYPLQKAQADTQPIDLYNAEAAVQLAWIYHLFGKQIKEYSPALYEKIPQELKRRMLDPGLKTAKGDPWWYGKAMNWNTWICANWLATVLLAETDRDRQIEAVRKIAASLDSFIDQYPNDGGCDEGPMYFDKATGSLLDNIALLRAATNSAALQPVTTDPKLQRMASYLSSMMIAPGTFVNFADSPTSITVRPQWFTGASALGYAPFMSMIADDAVNNHDYFNKPSLAFHEDNIPSLNRELMAMTCLGDLKAMQGETVLSFDAWMPDVQILTARSYPNSAKGLFLAAKGGHNDESHNHNDVGSFLVYADGEPLLIDPGVATYLPTSFTAKRYDEWQTQSLYHNTPVINGKAQRPGRDYKAKVKSASINSKRVKLQMDLAGAYGPEANAKEWVRTLEFGRGKAVRVTEKFKLKSVEAPAQVVLITPAKPTLGSGSITWPTGHGITFDSKALTANVEEMEITDQRMRKAWPVLYRITLTMPSTPKSGSFSYTIY